MPAKVKHTKPTVFLSHSSNNRRELMTLKRLLDARAGGMIDFFLSSDDESITHGTIWPASVHAALNRMKLMLIFVSPAALESQWTFFEAGYGLCQLGSAKIYCLPGSFKDKLPPPFNLLQNRNLHSARDISLLIHQINEALQIHISEAVTKSEFDEIFRRPLFGQQEAGPRLSELVQRIMVKTEGPANSAEHFAEGCRVLEHTVCAAEAHEPGYDAWTSTDVRVEVKRPYRESLVPLIEITDEMRSRDRIDVVEDYGGWRPADVFEAGFGRFVEKSVAEVEEYNASTRARNAEIKIANEAAKKEPRSCRFSLLALDLPVSVQIVDQWIKHAVPVAPLAISVELHLDVGVETRSEALAAKVQRSPLAMQADGSLLWRDRAVVRIEPSTGVKSPTLEVKPRAESPLNLGDFQLEQLVSTLCELQILTPAPGSKGRRR